MTGVLRFHGGPCDGREIAWTGGTGARPPYTYQLGDMPDPATLYLADSEVPPAPVRFRTFYYQLTGLIPGQPNQWMYSFNGPTPPDQESLHRIERRLTDHRGMTPADVHRAPVTDALWYALVAGFTRSGNDGEPGRDSMRWKPGDPEL